MTIIKSIDEYINKIYSNYEITNPKPVVMEKLFTNSNISIPVFNNYNNLFNYKYNNAQLKQFVKHYKLKLTGNKTELLNRIYMHLKLSNVIVKIQKIFRGYLQKKCNKLHGPAFMNRTLCVNESDFLTGNTLIEIDNLQFFSFKDEDEFIYGFDIISLYNLILKSEKEKEVKNPYNRNNISKSIIKNIRDLIRISKTLKMQIVINIEEPVNSTEKTIELRALDLFQNIDSLGNYSDSSWFLNLTQNQLIIFIRELMDIWTYRAQLTNEIKIKICPPIGDPFRTINFAYFYGEESIENIKKSILTTLECLVNSGIDTDSKTLGAYYVLGALTIVSHDAALSLPWLFQSVSHFSH